MQEILFRGKRTDNGKWVYGCVNVMQNGNTYIFRYSQQFEVDPATVGQFTGLTDKNGRRIFEGDILKVKTGWKKSKGYKAIVGGVFDGITEKKGETYWTVEHKTYACEMGFMTFGIDRRFHKPLTSSRLYNSDAEVVGNIYDNPELLGESHEHH